MQGIIDSTKMRIFAKEPKIVKLFQELKLTPVRCRKKVHWFFLYVCNAKFAAFLCIAAGRAFSLT